MKDGTHLNFLALNQNIFGKVLKIGSGPVEGDSPEPIVSYEGLKIYLNGKHKLSDFLDSTFELEELISFGNLTHPSAMTPNVSGELSYELGISKDFFVIIIRLKLNEESNGESEEASDILSVIKKFEIPEDFDYGDDNNYFLGKEMLMSHFEYLFDYYDSYDQLIEDGWVTNNEQALNEVIIYYFDLKKSINEMEKELS